MNNYIFYGIFIIIIAYLIYYLFFHIGKAYSMKNIKFQENFTIPTPPNPPQHPVICTNTGGTIIHQDMENSFESIAPKDGKYCFIKEPLLYDGTWFSHIKKCPHNGEERTWNLDEYSTNDNNYYCGNDMIKLPVQGWKKMPEMIMDNKCVSHVSRENDIKCSLNKCLDYIR